jgi:hypothetical protein
VTLARAIGSGPEPSEHEPEREVEQREEVAVHVREPGLEVLADRVAVDPGRLVGGEVAQVDEQEAVGHEARQDPTVAERFAVPRQTDDAVPVFGMVGHHLHTALMDHVHAIRLLPGGEDGLTLGIAQGNVLRSQQFTPFGGAIGGQ